LAIKPIDVFYIESASNPSGKIPDFEAMFDAVRTSSPNCIIVIDNTWMSPILFNPFDALVNKPGLYCLLGY
jgi:cystathionine beta-lyase/cystathionine gamma-synthase